MRNILRVAASYQRRCVSGRLRLSVIDNCEQLNSTHLFTLLIGEVVAVGDVVSGNGEKHVRHSTSGCNSVDGNPLPSTVLRQDPDE